MSLTTEVTHRAIEDLAREVEHYQTSLKSGEAEKAGLSLDRIIKLGRHLENVCSLPSGLLKSIALEYTTSVALRICIDLGLAKTMPEHGSFELSDIATRLQISQEILDPIMRNLASRGIFTEVSCGVWAHSPMSLCLRETDVASDIHVILHDKLDSTVRLPAYLCTTQYKVPTVGHTVFNALHSTSTDFYRYSAEHDHELALRFANAMGHLGSRTIKLLTDQFPLLRDLHAAQTGGLVLDIGGGHGHASIALAHNFSSLDFIVLDLPAIVNQAESQKVCPEGLLSRLSYIGFDICSESADFSTVVIGQKGPIIYLVKQFLHDLDDNICLRLLSKLTSSLRDVKDRIVVIDTVLPQVGAQFVTCASGMIELSVFGGKHRTLAQWKALFDRLHPKPELQRVWEKTDPTNDLGILELGLGQ